MTFTYHYCIDVVYFIKLVPNSHVIALPNYVPNVLLELCKNILLTRKLLASIIVMFTRMGMFTF